MAFKFKHYSKAVHKEKTVELSMASGDQVVNADDGTTMTKSTIMKPETFIPSNIKKDVTIGGVTGSYEGRPTEEKTVELSMASGDQVVNSSAGKTISKVTITKPDSLLPENIKKDVAIGGVTGSFTGGGAILNVIYSDTMPTDTSKLWIKSAEPENIEVNRLLEGSPLGYSVLSVALPYRMRHHPVAMVGTKIYVFGTTAYPRKDIHVFDVATNTVSTLEYTFNYSLDEGTAVAIGNKIYLLSCDKSNTGYYMYEYDVETNILTPQKYFTCGGNNAMIAFEGSIYTIGGTATNDYPHRYVYRYDPAGKSIITVGTLTNGLHKSCSVSYGRYIYAFGGRSYQTSKYVPQLNVIRINVDTSEIVELDAAFTEEVYDMIALKLGKDIYLMGSYGKAASIYHFDAETETLDPTPLSGVGFVNQTGVRGIQYGNVLYCMGGGLNAASSNANIGKFVGTIPLTSGDIIVHEGEGKNTFDLVGAPTKVQIGVRNVYKGNTSNKAEFVDAYLHNGLYWKNVNTDDVVLNQVYAPTISLDGTTLTITPNPDNAGKEIGYHLYVGGYYHTIEGTTTVDLTTITEGTVGSLLSAAGTHAITVEACAKVNVGLSEVVSYSPASNAVEYTVSSGHTVTISMPEQGEYGASANVYVDDSTEVSATYSYGNPCTVAAQHKIYIDAAVDGFAVGWSGGSVDAVTTGGVTLTASDSSTATFSVTGDGTITTAGITD